MIDIHTHILPGVDDGARTVSDAIKMIRDSVKSGTREIILTPHCAPSYGFFNFDDETLDDSYVSLYRIVRQEGIPVILHPGMEVLYEGKHELAEQIDRYFPLCGSRYFLMEYYFDTPAEDFLEGISSVKEFGYVPVIAHPERYECVNRDWELVLEGKRKGALFQMNKGSISGRHGERARRCSGRLLEADAVDFIASDAHDPRYRNSRLDRVYQFIQEEYGQERAYRLFAGNPERIVHNMQIMDLDRSREL